MSGAGWPCNHRRVIEQPDPGAHWRQPVERLALAVAVVMAAAGLYLMDPAVVDLGPPVQPGRTEFIGAFLLAAGFVLAANVAWPKDLSSGSVWLDVIAGLVLGRLALYGFAAIQVILGVRALLAAPPMPWAALLLVPGIVTLAAATVDAPLMRGRRTAAPDPEPSEPQSGRIDPGATILGGLTGGLGAGLVLATVVIALALGFFLYELLDAVIFGQKVVPLGAAGEALWELVVEAGQRAVVFIILAALWMAAVIAWSLLRWLSRRNVPDAERDLTAAEVEYIDAGAAAITAYAREEDYVAAAPVISVASIAVMVALFTVGYTWVLPAVRPTPVVPAGGLLPLEIPPGSFVPIVGVFAAILLSGLPNSMLSRLSRRHAERSGWAVMATGGEFISLQGRLTDLVRRRVLRPGPPIDPGAFLRETNRWFERWLYGIATALVAVLLFLVQRDREAVDVLTADSIELTSYWTLERERYAYADLKQVQLRCHLTDKGQPVVGYELHLASGRTRNIHEGELFRSRFLAYEAVGARLAAAGVPFVPAAHRGLFRGGEPGYEPDCVRQLAASFPEDLRDRVTALFHLDELAAVEAIWPWDPVLAQATAAADRFELVRAVQLYTDAIESGRLAGHLLAFAHGRRGNAREVHEWNHGVRDSEMLLALGDYRVALGIEPTFMLHMREASVLSALGAYDEASAAYRRALEVEGPAPQWSLIGLAVVERTQGRHDAAMEYLDEALRLRDEGAASMPIHYHRARVRALQGDDRGVIEEITRGLAYQTDFAGAYHQRACAHARLGDFSAAQQDMARAMEILRADADEPWAQLPEAQGYRAEWERDRDLIDSMAGGSVGTAQGRVLCETAWSRGEALRARSPLLGPPQG